jgi:hypothetical protein
MEVSTDTEMRWGWTTVRKTLIGAALVAAGILVTVTTVYSFPITLDENDSYEFVVTQNDMLTRAEQSTSQSNGSATLQIHVADDGKDGPEKARIKVQGHKAGGAWVIPSSSSESYTWEIDVSEFSTPTLEVEVIMEKGDLKLLGAALNNEVQAAHSPIPSTILLFSVGLIGLVGVRKRFKK